MSALRSSKRQVPKPDLIGPHASINPIFDQPADWSAFRTRVLSYTGLGLALAALGFLVYGPWFEIRDVKVSGTRLLDPTSVKQTAERYLDGQRWLILPNRTIWILSGGDLARHLEQQIRQRISIDQVIIEKTLPHGLSIKVAERTPVATWTDGTLFGSVDKEGKIIELRPAPDENFPIVRDENKLMFSINSSVVKQEVITGVVNLAGQMKAANIPVSEYLIPVPVCPAPIVPETTTNTNTSNNSNSTNSAATGNTNSSNANSAPKNINVAVSVLPPCDLVALRFGSQEIHVQLAEDGPRVLFDRHNDLQRAVGGLQRVLAERATKAYKTIDVRFGDRVYVQ